MRKFIIYLSVYSFGIFIISIIFLLNLKNDIPDYDEQDLVFNNEKCGISFSKNNIPVLKTNTQLSFAYGVGYLLSRDRLFQLHLWRNLCKGEIAHTINNDSLINCDIFLKSLKLDTISQNIFNKLDSKIKEYLIALTDGFNRGLTERLEDYELPFIANKYKISNEKWKPHNFISIMIMQSITSGFQQKFYEYCLSLNDKIPKDFINIFINHLHHKNKELPAFANNLFLFFNAKDGTDVKFNVFEKNIVPALSYPVIWIKNNEEVHTLFIAGNPFPIFLGYDNHVKHINYSNELILEYGFFNKQSTKFDENKIFIKRPDGNVLWVIRKKANGFSIINNQTNKYIGGRINLPSINRWKEWYDYLFSDSITTINHPQLNLIVQLNNAENIVDMNFKKQWDKTLAELGKKDFFQHLVKNAKNILPAESSLTNSNQIAILNLMKLDNSFTNDFSISPLLWSEYVNFLSTAYNYENNEISNLIALVQTSNILPKNKFNKKQTFRNFLYNFEKKYSDNEDNWQIGNQINWKYNYLIKNDILDKIMNLHPIKLNLKYGLGENCFYKLTGEYFIYNVYTFSNNKTQFNSSITDQLNNPKFWQFNK